MTRLGAYKGEAIRVLCLHKVVRGGRECPTLSTQELPAHRLAQAWRLMQPSIAVLFTTENPDGSFNVAPFSWVKPTSQDPPMVTASLLSKPKKQRSLENIERTGEFVVNVPGLEMARELVLCCQKVPQGTSKLKLVGLATSPAKRVRPPRLLGARANLECEVVKLIETGDHCLVLAQVVAAGYSEAAYTESLLLRVEESAPCVHLEQYNRAHSQVHVFLECTSARIVEVPYLIPIPELQVPKDTW